MPAAQTVAGISTRHDESPVLRASNVTKNSGGLILGLYVFNTNTALEYFMIFKNLTPTVVGGLSNQAVPADGAVPDMCYPVPAGTALILDFPGGDSCPTSIVWVESTTQATKTIATTPKFIVKVDFAGSSR